jgi:hypothetical protein
MRKFFGPIGGFNRVTIETGCILLLLLGRRGPLGRFLDEHFGIVFAFHWTGAALASRQICWVIRRSASSMSTFRPEHDGQGLPL